ncbi:hypothetical protein Tco_0759150 [Tanacetum coccineum]
MDGFVIRTKKNNNSNAENNDMVNVNIDNENPTNNENLENDEVNADYDNENPINIENLENDEVNANEDNENILNNENLDNDEANASEDNENPIEENTKSPQNYYVDRVNHNIFDIDLVDNSLVNFMYVSYKMAILMIIDVFASRNARRHRFRLTPQLHESAGGLPSLKLSLHSCSLLGSMNAMGIETSIALVLSAREHECDTSFVLGKPPALS